MFGFARQALIAACHEGPWWQLDDWHPRCDPRIPLINREPVANYGCSPSQITQPLPLFFRRLLPRPLEGPKHLRMPSRAPGPATTKSILSKSKAVLTR